MKRNIGKLNHPRYRSKQGVPDQLRDEEKELEDILQRDKVVSKDERHEVIDRRTDECDKEQKGEERKRAIHESIPMPFQSPIKHFPRINQQVIEELNENENDNAYTSFSSVFSTVFFSSSHA